MSKKYARKSQLSQHDLDNIDEFNGEICELSSNRKKNEKRYDFNIHSCHKLTEKQKVILAKMTDLNSKMIIVNGLWGTSKSYLSVLGALQLLQKGLIKNIYYVRTPCESSNTAKIGTLPGGIDEKLAAYNVVMEDKLNEFLTPNIVRQLMESGIVQFLPPGLIRGRHLADSVLICDEASNFSWEDILLICSRLGENSKIFMVGDSYQNDIGTKSGFLKFIKKMNTPECVENGVHYFELLSKEDIVRSGFIRFLMEKLDIIRTETPRMFPIM